VPHWLIDALREPAAQLANLVGTLVLGVLTARIRGRAKRADRNAAAALDAVSEPVKGLNGTR
jgi:hypothetical protein